MREGPVVSDAVPPQPPGFEVAGAPPTAGEGAQRVAEPRPRVVFELPPDSGLVLVETRPAAAPAVEEAEPTRPRRVRPPRVTLADEPLQMVETTPKDSTPPPED